MKNSIQRISLWSGPRNISTTIMYAFAQRTDTKVFDEPLYGHYLSCTHAREYHPGADDILRTMENSGEKVVEMMLTNLEKPVLFFKNMTHHLLNLDRSFLKRMTNIILTRDPVEMLPSFDKVIHNPTMEDVGYELHTELIGSFKQMNLPIIVLDAKKVLLNPEEQLKKLCTIINLPFDKNMLQWKAGKRKEDGIWAKYWYDNIHQSTGFIPYSPKTKPFPNHLLPLLNACEPHYKTLLKLAI